MARGIEQEDTMDIREPEIKRSDILTLDDPHFSPPNVCIVSGCGSGIGRAVAVAAAANGLTVAGLDIDRRGGEKTARLARKSGFDAFTATLLYSKFQQHETIRSLGEELGRRYGIGFYYEDFRQGWKVGIEISKKEKMYRQQYCGCIYSEGERYLGADRMNY